ncbi:hypothetical protein [Synechococcus sp. PCC 6312]|uniref:hypothetical protein n=1 Tax=Synechococcus sp. (strain ATCC 27167 / PCC 6312) TaxID=195253 RepID=UPI00029F3894|nr:hypothetical protein [Synechococcus sp. PCC 6312]AFY60872.1 hypothetical protein Syn6312_1722 [Synechococcus sp. PCC 6312]
MTKINNENQELERELTPEELEAIAGGLNVGDRMAKLGGVMHGRQEGASGNIIGELGGRVAQAAYTLKEAFRGFGAMIIGDDETMADVQKNTMSRGEQVYQDVKDSTAGKILGGCVLVVGTAAAGGAIASGVRSIGTATIRTAGTRPLIPNSGTNTPAWPAGTPGFGGSPAGSLANSFHDVPLDLYPGKGSFAITGLQINQQSPIGEQLVEKSAGQFLSEDQLKQFGIPADARVVGYVGAKEADADFVKEFKATLGLGDNAKLGYLQVSWSHNGSPVRDVVPMIEMNDAQITANEPKKEELTTPQSNHLSRNRFYHPH